MVSSNCCPLDTARAERTVSASDRMQISCFAGTEIDLFHLGAPNVVIILELATLLLSNCFGISVREPIEFRYDEPVVTTIPNDEILGCPKIDVQKLLQRLLTS